MPLLLDLTLLSNRIIHFDPQNDQQRATGTIDFYYNTFVIFSSAKPAVPPHRQRPNTTSITVSPRLLDSHRLLMEETAALERRTRDLLITDDATTYRQTPKVTNNKDGRDYRPTCKRPTTLF